MKNNEITEELKRINERLDQLEKIHKIANEQPVFNEMSWKEISATDKHLFSVGDYKDDILKSGEPIRVYIANLEPFRLLFAIDGEYRMNDTDTNEGGWNACRMKLVTMKQIKNLLPDELVEVLEEHDGDELSLMSQEEYESFDIFKDKTMGDLFSGHYWYWLKTPSRSSSIPFCLVYNDGSFYYNYASYPRGVSVCLAIKNNQPA